jgi:hypothetical protein
VSTSGKLLKTYGPLGASVVAARPLAAGECLLCIQGRLYCRPSRSTLQVDRHLHVNPAGRIWGFINHSCDPNCRFDFVRWRLVANRPIPAGAELGFNYLTTEWDLASPFLCRCGASGCWGWIRGLRHHPAEQVQQLWPRLAPHLRRKLRRAAARVAASA